MELLNRLCMALLFTQSGSGEVQNTAMPLLWHKKLDSSLFDIIMSKKGTSVNSEQSGKK